MKTYKQNIAICRMLINPTDVSTSLIDFHKNEQNTAAARTHARNPTARFWGVTQGVATRDSTYA